MKKKVLATFLVIALCFVITGCGNNNSDKKEQKDTNNTIENKEDNKNNNNKNNDNNKKTNNNEDKFTITSDDTKYVVTNGTSSQVFYYEGEVITGYALFIDYGDNETAERMYEVYKASYESQDTVKSLTVNKNYLVIEYNDEYIEGQYKDQTISEIKAIYDQLSN